MVQLLDADVENGGGKDPDVGKLNLAWFPAYMSHLVDLSMFVAMPTCLAGLRTDCCDLTRSRKCTNSAGLLAAVGHDI